MVVTNVPLWNIAYSFIQFVPGNVFCKSRFSQVIVLLHLDSVNTMSVNCPKTYPKHVNKMHFLKYTKYIIFF